MRKILLMVLIIILLAVFGIMVTSGVTLGSFEVASIEKIVNDNKNLDTKIAELDNSIKTDYTSAKASLDSSTTKLQSSKQKYQDTINYSTEDEIKAANQTEIYDMSYIWTKMGLYATKNNVTIKADVSTGNLVAPTEKSYAYYNIAITAVGEYLSISEFIYAVENDAKLGFKIEDFIMVPYAEEKLQATFAIRNVPLNKDSLTAGGVITTQQENTVVNVEVQNNQDNQNDLDTAEE